MFAFSLLKIGIDNSIQQKAFCVQLIKQVCNIHEIQVKNVITKKRFASSLFSRTLTHKEERNISVPIDIMYEVVADVGCYKEFVPWCTKSTVTLATKQTAKAELAVGFGPVQERYKSTLIFNKPKYVKSICTDGRLFNMLDCTWRFSEGKFPTNCSILFDVSFEFRSLMHTKLAKLFFDEVVKKMVVAFEARAKQKYMLQKKIANL